MSLLMATNMGLIEKNSQCLRDLEAVKQQLTVLQSLTARTNAISHIIENASAAPDKTLPSNAPVFISDTHVSEFPANALPTPSTTVNLSTQGVFREEGEKFARYISQNSNLPGDVKRRPEGVAAATAKVEACIIQP